MLKKFVSMILICAVVVLPSFSVQVCGQIQSANSRQSGKEVSSKDNLKEVFAKEVANAKSEKSFTKEDADRLEKESVKQTAMKNNFSPAKIAISVGIVAAVALIVYLVTRKDDDDPPRFVQCVGTPCP